MAVLIYPLIAIILIAIHLGISKEARSRSKLYEIVLLYLIITCIGLLDWLLFTCMCLWRMKRPRSLVGQQEIPFQFEVGMADLAMGVTGMLCIWIRKSFWLATIITAGIFLFGDGIGHVVQASVHHNVAEYNSGFVLYFDLIIPLIALAIYFLYRKNSAQIKPD